MTLGQKIRRAGKIVFWPATIVVVLNIENLAEAFGLHDVLAEAVKGQGPLRPVWEGLFSDGAFHVGLVALGLGLAAWVDFFARKWDANHPTHEDLCRQQSWPIMVLADELAANSHRSQIPADLFSKLVSRYTILRGLGFGAPTVPLDDAAAFYEIHQTYLNLLWPLLNDGNVALAIDESKKWACEVTLDEQRRLRWPDGRSGIPVPRDP